MKLTHLEEVSLMRRSCAIHGITVAELKRLLESKSKADSAKADAVAKTNAQLKSMQMLKKTEIRSDKQSRTIVKALSSKLNPYEEFVAQTKSPEEVKKYGWVKSIFDKGKATQAESIALLSQSCISSMQKLDPYQVERVHLHCDEGIKKVALNFSKRFNLL
jgi:ribosomal protein L9